MPFVSCRTLADALGIGIYFTYEPAVIQRGQGVSKGTVTVEWSWGAKAGLAAAGGGGFFLCSAVHAL